MGHFIHFPIANSSMTRFHQISLVPWRFFVVGFHPHTTSSTKCTAFNTSAGPMVLKQSSWAAHFSRRMPGKGKKHGKQQQFSKQVKVYIWCIYIYIIFHVYIYIYHNVYIVCVCVRCVGLSSVSPARSIHLSHLSFFAPFGHLDSTQV